MSSDTPNDGDVNSEENCAACADVVESPDDIHVLRKCPRCGRTLRIFDRAPGGGMRIQPGDIPVVPPGAIRLSFDPLKSNSWLFRPGLAALAEMILRNDPPIALSDTPESVADAFIEMADHSIGDSILVGGFDLEDEEQIEKLTAVVKSNPFTADIYALQMKAAAIELRSACACGDIQKAVLLSCTMERMKAMLRFKTHMEDALWIAQCAGNIVKLLRIWVQNSQNAEEEFWQRTFRSHPFLLTQAMAVPVVVIGGTVYVGGTKPDGTGAKLVDFLLVEERSRDVALIEIKTPVTDLMKKKWYRRGVFTESADLAGAVAQARDYRRNLRENFSYLREDIPSETRLFEPRCVVIIGNSTGLDQDQRRCFETYRAGLKDVEVFTYDEIFGKLGLLLEVLGSSGHFD